MDTFFFGFDKANWWIFLLSFTTVFTISAAHKTRIFDCKTCHCDDAMTKINCTSKDIRRLDNVRFPETLTQIILDNNNIDEVPRDFLQRFPNLQWLSLRHNRLGNLTDAQFCKHSNLSHIYLDGNQIKDLNDNTFEGCETLETLSLRNNMLTIDIIASILPSVSYLKILDCSFNDFGTPTILPENFSHLTQLNALFLERMDIRYIPSDFFIHLNSSQLMQVSIGYNSLLLKEIISSDAFTQLSTLVAMDISHTQLLSNGTTSIFKGIKQSRDLARIDMRGNFIFDDVTAVFDDDRLFRELENNSIRVLHLEDNYGGFQGNLHKNFLAPLRHLEELYLDHNRLQSIHSRALNRLHDLKLLSLKNNYLNCLTDCRFLSVSPLLPELEILDLSQNALDDTAGYLAFHPDSFPKLRRLNLRENRITAIRSELWFSLRTLRHLDLSNNPIRVLEPESFVTLGKLSQLTIEDCLHIEELPKLLFSGLFSLTELRLSRNGIRSVDRDTWFELNNLKLLDLSHNDLGNHGDIVDITIPSNNLTTLDLSHNNIGRLPTDMVTNGSALHTLYLHHNRFATLDRDIYRQFTELRKLDVSYNDLTSIDGQALQQVGTQLEWMNIEGNPFFCSCDTRDSIAWLKSNRHMIVNARNLTCLGPNSEYGTALLSYKPHHCGEDGFHMSGDDEQYSACFISIVITLSVLILIIIFIVVVLCVYYCRRLKHNYKKTPNQNGNEVNISVTSVNGGNAGVVLGGSGGSLGETALTDSGGTGSYHSVPGGSTANVSNTNQAIHILSKCIPIIKFSPRRPRNGSSSGAENGNIDAPLMDNIVQESEANI